MQLPQMLIQAFMVYWTSQEICFLVSGCKESQFHSLSFEQAIASMY